MIHDSHTPKASVTFGLENVYLRDAWVAQLLSAWLPLRS